MDRKTGIDQREYATAGYIGSVFRFSLRRAHRGPFLRSLCTIERNSSELMPERKVSSGAGDGLRRDGTFDTAVGAASAGLVSALDDSRAVGCIGRGTDTEVHNVSTGRCLDYVLVVRLNM